MKKGDAVLGGVLRSARREAGLSQTKLEVRTGIPKASLSRYENGWMMPSIESLSRIAEGLGVTGSELLRRAGR